ATLIIKVGVQGRVILGPMGSPGQVEVPLRYAVVREGPQPKTVVTKFKRIAVTVAPGQTHVQFVDIEEGLAFPMPSKSELEVYVVYVGLEEMGEKNEKKPPKRARKAAARQKKTTPVLSPPRGGRPGRSLNAAGQRRSCVPPPVSAARRGAPQHGCRRQTRVRSYPPPWRRPHQPGNPAVGGLNTHPRRRVQE